MTLTSTINSSSGINVNYGATNYLDTITDAYDFIGAREFSGTADVAIHFTRSLGLIEADFMF